MNSTAKNIKRNPVISSNDFRLDYTYNDKTNAYYKLHIEAESFDRANLICMIEGASLMIPTSDYDVSQVHEMFKKYPDLKNFAWIGDDGNNHMSAEEQPIINLDDNDSTDDSRFSRTGFLTDCDVITRDGEIKTFRCYKQLPFVCKISAQAVNFDNRCMVYGTGYQYFANVGSCYKIPRVAYSWNQAYQECRSEGAHLAVINSETERQALKNLINVEPSIPDAHTTYFFYVGIRAQKTTDGARPVFKTIFNQTLDKAGFNTWADNEPNNALNNEYCGTIFKRDAKYNDVDCSNVYAFICENEVKTN
ncbi:unnamed protein product [Euphydryas editha]|uniref:C-type lectin domain-containing protein n=1 Tax=Euphydryas editha TaxID=104508 RepID=A0AAU9TGM2_EUPED|nr:unnamed protein product [Euphydryas editha]